MSAYAPSFIPPVVAFGPAVTATGEVVVCTLLNVNTAGPEGQIVLAGQVMVTAGASATGIRVRARLGSDITGSVIGGTPQQVVIAGDSYIIPLNLSVQVGEVAGQEIVMTIEQLNGTGAPNVAFCAFMGYTC